MNKFLFIFDIDGTLADVDHRVHHVSDGRRDWNAFFDGMTDDAPKDDIIRLYHHVLDSDDLLFIFTGRPFDYQRQTIQWLLKHDVDINEDDLFMRKSGDFRSDVIVKKEMLDTLKQTYPDFRIIVIDDRQSVVDMWRKEGVTCLQCAPDWESNRSKSSTVPGKLILMIGTANSGKSTYVNKHLSHLNVISSDKTRQYLSGDATDQTINSQVFSYIKKRVIMDISHGLDTVVDATNLRDRDRKFLINDLPSNTEVEYIVINNLPLGIKAQVDPRKGYDDRVVNKHQQIFNSNIKNILSGDNGKASVKEIKA